MHIWISHSDPRFYMVSAPALRDFFSQKWAHTIFKAVVDDFGNLVAVF